MPRYPGLDINIQTLLMAILGRSNLPVQIHLPRGRAFGGWRMIQILASLKCSKRVINLARSGDGDSEGDDGDLTEVSWPRTTRTARHRVRLTAPFRSHPGRRPTPFLSHCPLCQSHRHTPPTISQRRRQRPHPVGRNTFGLTPSVVQVIPQTSTTFRQAP